MKPQQLTQGQVKDFTRGMLVNSIADDKQGVIWIFRKHGVPVADTATDAQLYIGALAGANHSVPFKKDVTGFLKNKISAAGQMNADGASSYVSRFLQTHNMSYLSADATADSQDTVLNKQRIGNYLDAGMSLIFNALGRKQQGAAEDNAIKYEAAQADKFKAIATAAAAQNDAGAGKKWMGPVLIGLSLLLVGGLGYWMYKKNAKK